MTALERLLKITHLERKPTRKNLFDQMRRARFDQYIGKMCTITTEFTETLGINYHGRVREVRRNKLRVDTFPGYEWIDNDLETIRSIRFMDEVELAEHRQAMDMLHVKRHPGLVRYLLILITGKVKWRHANLKQSLIDSVLRR